MTGNMSMDGLAKALNVYTNDKPVAFYDEIAIDL